MKYQRGYTIAELLSAVLILAIILVGAYGWTKNVLAIANCDIEHMYQRGIFLVRVAGVFIVPLGAVLGFV